MDIKKVFNTVKYLKPIQLFSYFKRGGGEFDLSLKPERINNYSLFIEELDDAEEKAINGNQITLLHETANIPYDTWEVPEKSHLWNFNLHYLEHCNDKMLETYNLSAKDALHPYTISLRIINVLIKRPDLAEWLYPQYRYLINNQETRLLANHYFENLKTIVICALICDEEATYKKYIKKLIKQCREQILPDGVHFELSPMYQKIILEDLIRVAFVLKQAGKEEYKEILPYVKKMVDATASIEKGFNRTPLFNDSGDNVAKPTKDLINAAERLFNITAEFKDELPHGGYYKLYDGNISVIVDAGAIGPDYMPGHGHCDCQSFELAVDGIPVLVNSGTYAYQTELRKYFRDTAAHNTLTINGHEQSECWGEHRVARRIKVKDKNTYHNYLGEEHSREITLTDKVLRVIDKTSSGMIESYLHVAPGYEDKIQITPINCEMKNEEYTYAPEFGQKIESTQYVFTWASDNNKHGYEVKLW